MAGVMDAIGALFREPGMAHFIIEFLPVQNLTEIRMVSCACRGLVEGRAGNLRTLHVLCQGMLNYKCPLLSFNPWQGRDLDAVIASFGGSKAKAKAVVPIAQLSGTILANLNAAFMPTFGDGKPWSEMEFKVLSTRADVTNWIKDMLDCSDLLDGSGPFGHLEEQESTEELRALWCTCHWVMLLLIETYSFTILEIHTNKTYQTEHGAIVSSGGEYELTSLLWEKK